MNKEEFEKLKNRAHNVIDTLETSNVEALRRSGDVIDQYIHQLEYEKPKDTYHTMDELYDHRTVLFALVCKAYNNLCWKSKCHSDGSSEEGWFIAGIQTPYGQATYHQKIEYWNLFECKELDKAPFYDGHTPQEALERLKLLIVKGI